LRPRSRASPRARSISRQRGHARLGRRMDARRGALAQRRSSPARRPPARRSRQLRHSARWHLAPLALRRSLRQAHPQQSRRQDGPRAHSRSAGADRRGVGGAIRRAPVRVLIVGAGIGGLTLAHALRQRGLSFDLVERAERWEPVGAGLGLWSNALRVLDRLGLCERVVAAGIPFTGGEVTDERGRGLTSVHYPSSDSRIPVGVALLHYDLHEALRHGLEDSTRMATTYPRVRGDYDLVVGADGIGSQVRERFWGTVPIRDAGYTSWRFVV